MMKALKRLLGDTRAVAALEFALAVPFLLVLFVASTDLMRLMLIHQKAERIAYNIADLTAQTEAITAADMQQIMLAPAEVMEPFTFGARGVVIISSVHKAAAADDQLVRWRCEGGGTLEAESLIGSVGSVANLPNNLVLNERENVIVTEVYYIFESLLPVNINDFMNVGPIYKTAVFKPRFGALLTAPC